MNHTSHVLIACSLVTLLVSVTGCSPTPEHTAHAPVQTTQEQSQPMNLQIIVASVRPTKTGLNIAQHIKTMIDKRDDVVTEIIDSATYALPLYADAIVPAQREGEISDPALKQWSDTIKQADAYIIISPEYNGGYPASLKNELDSLYTEWNNKPVAIVGYSGGPSGGSSMIAQLREVVRGLNMIPVDAEVRIPESWKAFDQDGRLVNAADIDKAINILVDQLIQART